jgi:DNA-binding IclR family transcriptional regulator
MPTKLSPTERDTNASGRGLDRAAAILGAFDAAHRELTLSSLVRRSGLPRSTTHRTADTMIRLGWLDKPDGHYRIGNRLFEISGLAPIRHELREAVLPFLQDLYNATHTAVQLGVLHGPEVLIVEKITGHRPMTITNPDTLRRELAAIPDRGWAFEREEGNVGVSCVGAPIFGPVGDVVAALSVTGPSAVVRSDRVGPAVRLAAAAASRAYSTRR